ncbi:MAG TPA: S53 family peptidase [Hanamia sp.]|nr:S53 family peptidase [Hanamia sp.]
MAEQSNFKLAGSYRSFPLATTDKVSEPERSEIMEVTVMLRRKKKLPPRVFKGNILSRKNYENTYASAREDANKVEAFAHTHGLSTVEVNLARRSIILRGTLSDFETAFNTHLQSVNNFRALTSEVQIPESLSNIITGVFGLDSRPVAKPRFQVAKKEGKIISHAQSPHSFTPDQLAKIYGFPIGFTGKGQCIGIIELGGGFRSEDISNYFKSLSLEVPTVKAISVDGGKNSPSTADSADGEVMLDIEVAGTVANGATIAVYFTPNTDQGFLDAITTTIHDTNNQPSVISISWGAAEVNWTTQALDNFNEAFKTAAALGVSICVASGDSGSRDGETDGKVHVDFPSSSPYALACGGTHLEVSNNKISSETVWNDSDDSASGGGVSTYFPLADYQVNANVPPEIDTKFKGRGSPDVAANADPDTGYNVLVDGQQLVIGGTSAVAPLMAALIALFNEQYKKPSGFIHPQLYADPGLCRDITEGNNKTTSADTGYTAGPGWDACSGWGVLFKKE